jgi:Cu/Zn superoxide dismutase
MTFRTAALGIALAAALGSTAAIAVAQISPNDLGFGTKLGIEQQNNSGEVGTVTLFRRGPNTLVDLQLFGEPPGRSQPAHIHRGSSCDNLDPTPAFGLAPVVNGHSRTLVHYPLARLVSGNYVVNVHASSSNLKHYVACGHLIPQG